MLSDDSLIDFLYFNRFFQRILNSKNLSQDSELYAVLQAIIRFPNVSVYRRAAAALGLVDFDTFDWSLVGYYDTQYACAINFFLSGEKGRLKNYFTLSFVCYNFIVTVAILITYLLMTFKISGTEIFAHICNWCLPESKRLLCKNLSNTQHSNSNNTSPRSKENKELICRITVIIVSNLVCWIPLCIAAIIIGHNPIATSNGVDFLHTLLSIQTAMLFVVPFNSILNPHIYSYHLWKDIYLKIKNAVGQALTRLPLQREVSNSLPGAVRSDTDSSTVPNTLS